MRDWMPWFYIALLLGVVAFLILVSSGSVALPPCQLREWTGMHCPGCGGTRAVRHLLGGHWLTAARSNILIYPIALASLWAVVAFLLRRLAGIKCWTPARIGKKGMWVLLALIIVFTVLRNLEWGACLRP